MKGNYMTYLNMHIHVLTKAYLPLMGECCKTPACYWYLLLSASVLRVHWFVASAIEWNGIGMYFIPFIKTSVYKYMSCGTWKWTSAHFTAKSLEPNHQIIKTIHIHGFKVIHTLLWSPYFPPSILLALYKLLFIAKWNMYEYTSL